MDNRLKANELIFHLNAVSVCISLARSSTGWGYRHLIKFWLVKSVLVVSTSLCSVLKLDPTLTLHALLPRSLKSLAFTCRAIRPVFSFAAICFASRASFSTF